MLTSFVPLVLHVPPLLLLLDHLGHHGDGGVALHPGVVPTAVALQ